MLLLLLPYLIQIVLIIHAVRHGKTSWIWLLIVLPYVGGAVYFFLEILPDLRRGRWIDPEALRSLVDQEAKVKRLKENILISDTVANHLELADEYVNRGAYAEAAAIYRAQLTGVYRDDRAIQLKLAQCAFLQKDYPTASEFFSRADAQAPLTATDAKVHRLYSLFRTNPTLETLGPLESLFELTKNSEAGYYLALAYQRMNLGTRIERLVSLMAIQHKKARGAHRAASGEYLQRVKELIRSAAANP